MNELFFELIRVAIGNSDSLSHIPKQKEWIKLYGIACKQCLAGVCFAGIQRLGADAEDGFENIGMSEVQYFSWICMAADIQQRNELVNRQCVRLQERFAEDGFRSCIIKGQAVACYYPSVTRPEREDYPASSYDLATLRQSGDIDVWLDTSRKRLIEYATSISPDAKVGDVHVALDVFADTDVEVHYTPSTVSMPRRNRYLQQWYDSRRDDCCSHRVQLKSQSETEHFCVTCPDTQFNVVYLLLHIFKHYLYEGIGLRQLMDYYFVLRAFEQEHTDVMCEQVRATVDALALRKFALAILWTLGTVFDNNPSRFSALGQKLFGAEPDGKAGARLLEVVMEGGNFGHSTRRYKVTGWDRPWSRVSRYIRRNLFLFRDYPSEIFGNILRKFF